MDAFVQLVSNVGFPIACCVFMFINQNKLTETISELSATMQAIQHRLEDIEHKLDK